MSKKRRVTKKTRTARKRSTKRPARPSLSALTSKAKAPQQRMAAMRALPLSASGKRDQLESLLAILRDGDEPLAVRLEALKSLGAAQFASPSFASIAGSYTAALRKVASDPEPELRQRALGILARERDGYAQQLLIEGLQDPKKARLAPEKALQLLGYDPHTDAYDAARTIVSNPPNPTAKREALRLLAADATSAPTFETLLRDKQQPAEIRQISAAALHALNPQQLQAQARDIVLDPNEGDEIRETSLTALQQFGSPAIGADKPLLDRIDQLSSGGSPKVRSTAQKLLRRYKP